MLNKPRTLKLQNSINAGGACQRKGGIILYMHVKLIYLTAKCYINLLSIMHVPFAKELINLMSNEKLADLFTLWQI